MKIFVGCYSSFWLSLGHIKKFGHIERMENDRIAKRVYVGVCEWWDLVKGNAWGIALDMG